MCLRAAPMGPPARLSSGTLVVLHGLLRSDGKVVESTTHIRGSTQLIHSVCNHLNEDPNGGLEAVYLGGATHLVSSGLSMFLKLTKGTLQLVCQLRLLHDTYKYPSTVADANMVCRHSEVGCTKN